MPLLVLAERRGFGERDDAGAGRQQRRGDLLDLARARRRARSPASRPAVMRPTRSCCSRASCGGDRPSRSAWRSTTSARSGRRRSSGRCSRVGRVVDRVGGRDQLHRIGAVVDEDVADARCRRASPAAPSARPVMSMPRSEARSRSIVTESCGCVGVVVQARLSKRGSFSISATIFVRRRRRARRSRCRPARTAGRCRRRGCRGCSAGRE